MNVRLKSGHSNKSSWPPLSWSPAFFWVSLTFRWYPIIHPGEERQCWVKSLVCGNSKTTENHRLSGRKSRSKMYIILQSPLQEFVNYLLNTGLYALQTYILIFLVSCRCHGNTLDGLLTLWRHYGFLDSLWLTTCLVKIQNGAPSFGAVQQIHDGVCEEKRQRTLQ